MIPENISDLSLDELKAKANELRQAFDKAYEAEAPLDELGPIAEAIKVIDNEITDRETAQAEAAEERKRLAESVKAVEVEEVADEAEEVEAVEVEAVEEVAADEPELVTASARKPSPRQVAPRTSRPTEAPASDDPGLVITASADVPGYSNGQQIDRLGIARGMHARARGLGDSAGKRTVYGVAQITSPVSSEFMIRDGSDDAESVIKAAVDSQLAGRNAEALVAAGGWCAPSETMYDLFSVEARDGLFDMPTVGIARGGMQIPDYIGLGDVAGSLWTWTETDDSGGAQAVTDIDVATLVATATVTGHGYVSGQQVSITGTGFPLLDGTYVITVTGPNTFTFATAAGDTTNQTGVAQVIKGCLRVPCPGFTDVRLEAEGLCITAGNLTDRAYPELTARTIDLAMTAHLHALSTAKIAKVAAGATAVTVATAPSDAAGDILNAIDLQVADYRSQHVLGEGTVLDLVAPHWWLGAIRSTLAMRAGVNDLSVSDEQVRAFFTMRNVRPQFVYGYDPLYTSAPATAWKSTSTFLLYPTGGYVAGDGGTIDLGVIRDSILNATNDFTAAWVEVFYSVMRRGPLAREVTVTTDVTGQTGGAQFAGV